MTTPLQPGAPLLSPDVWRPAWRHAGALCLVALLAWACTGLGLSPLFDVDEGAFAESSREMLASGDWGHTTLNGKDRFDKPILVYWLQAGSMALFGTNEWAVRLPSSLCAALGVLALFRFVQPRLGTQAALLAAAIQACALGPMAIGRAATADALLGLLLLLTFTDLWRALEPTVAPTAAPLRRDAWRRTALWIGLGLLAKGPVAVVVPGGAWLLWWATAPRGRRPAWRPLFTDAAAWAIVLSVSAPWYAYALHRHGRAFVDGFLMRHNVERFTGTLQGHAGGLGYYLVLLPMLLLPWTPLLWTLARRLTSRWRTRELPALDRFSLAWVLFVLGFFSLSGTKLPHYVLYGFAPLALLLGEAVAAAPGRAAVRSVGTAAALLVVAGAASPWLLQWIAARARGGLDAHWAARIDAASMPAPPSAVMAAAVLAAVGWATIVFARRQPTVALAVVGALAAAWTALAVTPWWGMLLQEPVRSLALQAKAQGLPLVQWELNQPSAGFYRGEPAPTRPPRPGELALTRRDRLDLIEARDGPQGIRLATRQGFVLLARETPPAHPAPP